MLLGQFRLQLEFSNMLQIPLLHPELFVASLALQCAVVFGCLRASLTVNMPMLLFVLILTVEIIFHGNPSLKCPDYDFLCTCHY